MDKSSSPPDFNFAHLEHLSEDVERAGETLRIVHLYAAAPDYRISADPYEGTACVDDTARAAVLYLRHFEITGESRSAEVARSLLRFVMYMQADNGLFHNFVLSNRLDINRDHDRSRADVLGWWTARAVWALGTGVRALRTSDPAFVRQCREALQRVMPHLHVLLKRYPQTIEYLGRVVPLWLVNGDGADATSEMLLGLIAMQKVEPDAAIQTCITQFAEGIALMRYGSMNTFPYGLHASNRYGWHKWGNTQTQALAEAGITASARLEAEHFYPRLLVEGFVHSVKFDDLHAIRYFERIAYGVRCVAVGLVRLYEATGDPRYAIMAGLAASWFTGNNAAGELLYDPATGRGYDGVDETGRINRNSGAESTIEALYSLLEVSQHPRARHWMHARSQPPRWIHRDDTACCERLYEVPGEGGSPIRIALVMDLGRQKLDILEGDALAFWQAEHPR